MKKIAIFIAITTSMLYSNTLNPKMQEYVNSLQSEAKKENSNFKNFDVKRGEEIFTSTHIGKRGTKVSCTSCHSKDLTASGENINTNKIIEPLAPSVNKSRLTKVKDVKKWLRRNFRDVYNRVGSAKEKGDVLTYILSK